MLELAEIMVDELGTDVSIEVEENRTGEVRRYIADISKAKKFLEYESEYGIRDGIKETVDWYLNRKELFDSIVSGK